MSVNSAEPAARLEVVLVKAGRTKIRYPAELLHDDGDRIAVRAPWAGSGVRDFGFVRFEPSDVFTEYYWRDRWYSVKEDACRGRLRQGLVLRHHAARGPLRYGPRRGGPRPGSVALRRRAGGPAAGRGRVRRERPRGDRPGGRVRRGGRARTTLEALATRDGGFEGAAGLTGPAGAAGLRGGDHRVPLVVHVLAPQHGVVGQPLHAHVPGQRCQEGGEPRGRYSRPGRGSPRRPRSARTGRRAAAGPARCRSTPAGSGSAHSTCRTRTTSKRRRSTGGATASPAQDLGAPGELGAGPLGHRRGRSTPVTRCPCSTARLTGCRFRSRGPGRRRAARGARRGAGPPRPRGPRGRAGRGPVRRRRRRPAHPSRFRGNRNRVRVLARHAQRVTHATDSADVTAATDNPAPMRNSPRKRLPL